MVLAHGFEDICGYIGNCPLCLQILLGRLVYGLDWRSCGALLVDPTTLHILLGHSTLLALGLGRFSYLHMDQGYWHTYQSRSTMEKVVITT